MTELKPYLQLSVRVAGKLYKTQAYEVGNYTGIVRSCVAIRRELVSVHGFSVTHIATGTTFASGLSLTAATILMNAFEQLTCIDWLSPMLAVELERVGITRGVMSNVVEILKGKDYADRETEEELDECGEESL